MMDWLRDFWTRVLFVFKPTYRVFSSIQDAVDALPARGGTLLVGPGEFLVGKEGVTIPGKDIRIVGGVYHMVPGSAGFQINGGGKHAIFIGCSFIGSSYGSAFTQKR